MRADEVLVFTQLRIFKSDGTESPLRSVFHTAFDDPTTRPGAEKRQSSECRTSVWFGAPDEAKGETERKAEMRTGGEGEGEEALEGKVETKV